MQHRSPSGLPSCKSLLWALAVWMWAPASFAQILMFDFGPTSPSGVNLTNSPAHFAGAATATQTTWNIVGTADVLSGLSYGNGTSAGGISILTGHESTDSSNILNYAVNPNFSNALGGQMNTGIYAGNSVATDAIFHTSTAAYAVGAQVAGLAPGQYDIYLSGRNTNINGSYSQRFYASSSAAGSTFDFNSLTPITVANSGTVWEEDTTYAVFNVTITEGQVLNIATSGIGTGAAGRGFLASLQIVSVPEPSVAGFLSLGVVTLLLIRRRRQPLS